MKVRKNRGRKEIEKERKKEYFLDGMGLLPKQMYSARSLPNT